jgi:riboflavin transporter 2
LIVDILIVLFSMGSWIGIKATFLEVPLLVDVAPEGWKLPSYFVAIVQIGNLGPVVYTALQKVRPMRDANMVYGVLTLGTVATIAMAVWYQETAIVFGANHSVAMFACFLFFSIVGCTSSVLFMPYMGRFREIYLITYIFGVDLSGLFTSLVVMGQGVGGAPECVLVNATADPPIFEAYRPPPRFGVSALFYFVTVLMVLSIVAFTLLDRLKRCRKQHAAVLIQHGNDYTYQMAATEEENSAPKAVEATKVLSNYNFYYLLVLQGLLCLFGNAFLPSIQSFSALPYGNWAYHLVVTLSTIASPVACFAAFFLPHHSIRQVTVLTGVSCFLSIYATVTALMSPLTPLVDSHVGVALIVSDI